MNTPAQPTPPHWLTPKRMHLGSLALLLLFIVVTSLFIKVMLLAPNAENSRTARDFITFYAASDLALQDHAADVYDHEKLKAAEKAVWPNTASFSWFYPPTYLVMVYPLALLDYLPAFALFMALTMMLFYYSARCWLPTPESWLPILAFPAVATNLMFGQNGLLTAGLALLALFHLERRPVLTGILVGLLTIKPHLALLFPLALMLGKHWQALRSTIITTLAFMLISLLILGDETWRGFLHSPQRAQEALETGRATWRTMITLFANMRMQGTGIASAYIAQALLALPYLITMVWVWRRNYDIYLRGSILALATLHLSPYQFDYELSWLAIPLLLLSARGIRLGWSRRERDILLFAWLFPALDLTYSLCTGARDNELSLAEAPQLLLLWLIYRKAKNNTHHIQLTN